METCVEDTGFCHRFQKIEKALSEYVNNSFQKLGFEIRFEDWATLQTLYNRPKITQQELADVLYKDKTFITRIVDKLEERMWVKRLSCKSDRRNKFVKLTKEGNLFYTSNKDIVNENVFGKIAGILESHERKALNKTLDVLFLEISNLIKTNNH